MNNHFICHMLIRTQKRSVHFKPGILLLTVLLSILIRTRVGAQSNNVPANMPSVQPMNLESVISLLKVQNLNIQSSHERVAASAALVRAAKDHTLPNIYLNTSYQRFTKLTLFDDGLSHHQSVPRFPDQNSLSVGAESSFNLYNGGKEKLNIHLSELNHDLEHIRSDALTGDITLQVVFHYLDIIRLMQLDTVLNEEVKRAKTRLKNIQALYDNETVTKSDLLRAQVNLSSSELSLKKAQNDLTIANQQLNILIGLPDSVIIQPVDDDFPPDFADAFASNAGDGDNSGSKNAYELRQMRKTLEIQKQKVQLMKSNYKPSIQLHSAYGLQYPNQLFTPPVARWYSVGFLGLSASYRISALFQNKNKVKAEEMKERSIALDKAHLERQIAVKLQSLKVKYGESLDRIRVAERSIQQAKVNLKIVSLKYFNQLALLTDLLDADKLLVYSTYDLVKAKMDRRLLHYQIYYVTGQL